MLDSLEAFVVKIRKLQKLVLEFLICQHIQLAVILKLAYAPVIGDSKNRSWTNLCDYL